MINGLGLELKCIFVVVAEEKKKEEGEREGQEEKEDKMLHWFGFFL